MLTVQLSVPEVKSQLQTLQAMALEPMAALQSLVSTLRGSFEGWLNELLQAELTLHLGREAYERKPGPRNHRNGYRARRITVKSS